MPSPGLDRRDPAGRPRGLVLMLHGGAKPGSTRSAPRSASLRRTTAMRNALEPRVLEQGLSLWLLRFGVRGWNAGAGPEPSPVPTRAGHSARRRHEHPGLPVVLLGHSMGARTASTSPTTRSRRCRRAGSVVRAPRPGATARRPAPGRRARQPRPDHVGTDDAGVRRPGPRRRRLGEVRRHGPTWPLHAAPAGRVEPASPSGAPWRCWTWPSPASRRVPRRRGMPGPSRCCRSQCPPSPPRRASPRLRPAPGRTRACPCWSACSSVSPGSVAPRRRSPCP